jgi:hypothetical protein
MLTIGYFQSQLNIRTQFERYCAGLTESRLNCFGDCSNITAKIPCMIANRLYFATAIDKNINADCENTNF